METKQDGIMGRKKGQLDAKIHQTLFFKMQLVTEQCFIANDNSNITDPVKCFKVWWLDDGAHRSLHT